METQFLIYRSSTIAYRLMGNGAEWLCCFHGYGEVSSSFLPIAAKLGNRFTLLAIDFPFHGETDWQEGLLFTPADLAAIIHLIKPASVPMRIMGYSMGGRIALTMLSYFPEEISGLLLIAPDGFHRNRWQLLATRTKAGNLFFAWVMRNPTLLLGWIQFAHRMKLFNPSIYKFVHHYLAEVQQRMNLYLRWTTLRQFNPNLADVEKILLRESKRLQLLYGAYDKIIKAVYGQQFQKKAPEQVQVTVIEAGHVLLREKYVNTICELLVQEY